MSKTERLDKLSSVVSALACCVATSSMLIGVFMFIYLEWPIETIGGTIAEIVICVLMLFAVFLGTAGYILRIFEPIEDNSNE